MPLIFDEVVSGFRHRFGPVSDLFDVQPDLLCFGKIIGGGLPVGAYAGKSSFMSLLEGRGSVFQGGTFAGSALTMAAGIAQLRYIEANGINARIESSGAFLVEELRGRFKTCNLPYAVQRYGSLVTLILVKGKAALLNHLDVEMQDKALFRSIHRSLMSRGILIPPTVEEPIFISALHTTDDLLKLCDGIIQGIKIHYEARDK